MKKILHVISNLEDGGAENSLYRLCISSPQFNHIVVCMMDRGKYGPLLEQNGVQIYYLMLPRGKITFKGIYKFCVFLQDIRPDVIQTWMYHADLFGGLLCKLFLFKKIFWGVRHGNLESGTLAKKTIFIAKLCALLSHWIPLKIISCSEQALSIHSSLGYSRNKFIVIPNGYDFSKIQADQINGKRLRSEWFIPEDVFLIGMVARYDLQKDHMNLFAALKILHDRGVPFHCILVGSGIVASNHQLMQSLLKHDLQNVVSLIGQRKDIPAVMSSLDLHVLSSLGEGFPNVLVEAMACGTPCVTTDVGDAKIIVGDTGWIVPRKDPESLSYAIHQARSEFNESSINWNLRKYNARKRVVNNYGIKNMTDLFAKVWEA
jgi:glycosyltransferase involved in cell wall biosynthesis